MTSITKPSLTEVSQTCDRKSGLTRHISFLKCIQRFLASKGNGNIFLRIVSRIIRQYNLHSWEFVINAQLNSSKSLRLWNLWPIILLYCIPLQTTVRFALCHLPENGCFMSQMSQWVMSHESMSQWVGSEKITFLAETVKSSITFIILSTCFIVACMCKAYFWHEMSTSGLIVSSIPGPSATTS